MSSAMAEIEREKLIHDLFGCFSATYDEHMLRTNHVAVQTVLLQKLEKYIGHKVLDIACGTGTIAAILQSLKKCHYTGVDFQTSMLECAEQKGYNQRAVVFQKLNVHHLDQLHEQYDTVICAFGLYWFCEPHVVVNKMRSRLRERGYAVILEERFFEHCEPLPTFNQHGGYLKRLAELENYLGVQQLKQLFIANHFTYVEEMAIAIDERHELVGLVWSKNGLP